MSDICAFDFESLSTIESAVILSMGCAVFKEAWLSELIEDFTPEKCTELFKKMLDSGLYLKFDVKDQVVNYKRTIDPGTITWWKGQGDTAKSVLLPSSEDISISELENKLQEFFKYEKNPRLVYSRGNVDMTWYQSVLNHSIKYEGTEKSKTFPWWSNRDIRTVIDECLMQETGKLPPNLEELVAMNGTFIKHNALHDAAVDCMNIVIARVVMLGLAGDEE